MLIFGHRGAPGYPRRGENTIASFRKALQAGASGIEFDVRRCADGQIVVIHDTTIDRTTNGRGRVSKLTYDQLRRFGAGGGESIPLLDEVLDEFGGKCLLNVELKDPGLGGDVKDAILRRRLERHVIISCFEWNELRSCLPEIPIALLSSKRRNNLIPSAREMGATAIHPSKDIVTPDLLARARDAGLQISVWTVNDPAEVKAFRSMGVDRIFSDFPDKCSMPQS